MDLSRTNRPEKNHKCYETGHIMETSKGEIKWKIVGRAEVAEEIVKFGIT